MFLPSLYLLDFSPYPLDSDQIVSGIEHPEYGAISLYLANVRRRNGNQLIKNVEIQIFEPLARKNIMDICHKAQAKFGNFACKIQYRYGKLKVGDSFLGIGVASSKREQSQNILNFLLGEINKNLPLWRKESYLEGPSSWIN